MNPYLKAKRDQYEALRKSIEGIHSRASEHDNGDGTKGRALSEQETTLVREQNTNAQKLFEEIEELTKIDQRNRRMEELAGDLLTNEDRSRSLGGGTSSTSAKDRDPGHYRSEKDGGKHSFFSDLYRSKVNHDEVSTTRLAEYSRARVGAWRTRSGTSRSGTTRGRSRSRGRPPAPMPWSRNRRTRTTRWAGPTRGTVTFT